MNLQYICNVISNRNKWIKKTFNIYLVIHLRVSSRNGPKPMTIHLFTNFGPLITFTNTNRNEISYLYLLGKESADFQIPERWKKLPWMWKWVEQAWISLFWSQYGGVLDLKLYSSKLATWKENSLLNRCNTHPWGI